MNEYDGWQVAEILENSRRMEKGWKWEFLPIWDPFPQYEG